MALFPFFIIQTYERQKKIILFLYNTSISLRNISSAWEASTRIALLTVTIPTLLRQNTFIRRRRVRRFVISSIWVNSVDASTTNSLTITQQNVTCSTRRNVSSSSLYVCYLDAPRTRFVILIALLRCANQECEGSCPYASHSAQSLLCSFRNPCNPLYSVTLTLTAPVSDAFLSQTASGTVASRVQRPSFGIPNFVASFFEEKQNNGVNKLLKVWRKPDHQ